MHLKCMCTLFHQLCFLGAFAIADPHPFQESELVFPEVFPDTSPPAQDKPDSRDSDASAGSSSREVRSISNWDESPELDHLQSPRPQTRLKLKIPAFGRDLHMIVKKDTRFLSQKFMVERRYKAGKASPSNGPGSTAANAEETCYYSGTVLNEEGSIVSFSTCAGLMGFIQISDDFLYIEPVNRTVAVTGQAHRVYRRKRSADDRTHQEADNTREKQTTGCKVIPEKLRSKTKRPTDGGRGKRYSYKLLPEYNVETLVVADPAMVSYHGTEAAKRFILTIMNMTDMYIGHHGEKMLESFCHWQQEEYGRKSVHSDFSTRWREDLPSVDTAILITR